MTGDAERDGAHAGDSSSCGALKQQTRMLGDAERDGDSSATGLAARSRLGDRVRAAKSAVGGLSIVISRRRAARELEA